LPTPRDQAPSLSKSEIEARLTADPWRCVEVKVYAVTTLWRTRFGFYFSVPHDCTEADFEALMADVRKFGRRRNV
jgi:hypothetical protein